MLSIPGIVLLIAFIYTRPQEVYVTLQSVPLLYVFLGLALLGGVLDVKLGFLRLRGSQQLGLAAAFFAWCIFTLLVQARWALADGLIGILVPASLFFLLAAGLQSFRALEVLVATLLALALFVAAVGVDQGLHETVCHRVDWKHGGEAGISDGRPCETARGCESGDGAVQGADYMCEKPGVLATHSIGHGRVRYRGILEDPNDLSLASCIAIPFAFAFFERKKSAVRSVLLLAAIAIIGVCTVFAQSRGGQLVFLTATGVYFVRRFGFRGMILGAALATPMLLLGGRSGDEADSSADERTMCLYVGMKMFRDSPLFGVGKGQFVEHHTQTAHNSYVLAAAELGLPGMVLWALLLYLSMKIPFVYLRRTTRGELALSPVAQIWAVALSASLAAMYVGIFFLSFSYHDVLWISLGLAGAFYAAVRRHVPTFEVRVRWPEVLAVSALSCALLTLITLYAGWKVSHG